MAEMESQIASSGVLLLYGRKVLECMILYVSQRNVGLGFSYSCELLLLKTVTALDAWEAHLFPHGDAQVCYKIL